MAPTSLDPTKALEVEEWLKATPACLLDDLQPGATVLRKVILHPSQIIIGAPHYTTPDHDRAAAKDAKLYYPNAGLYARSPGRVVLNCDVKADGSLENCIVASEDPPNLGFGAAAIRSAQTFRFLPSMRDCQPITGAAVVVPVVFTPPG
jgi:TonB family protein